VDKDAVSRILPLGIFARAAGDDTTFSHRVRSARRTIEKEERSAVAHYLRSGTVIVATMEYTKDVIADEFVVAGGSGINSDGRYYWRADAAEYVEHYGIEIPKTAIALMRARNWNAPMLSPEKVVEVDRLIWATLAPHEGV
jgi:hypothetical protein